MKSHAGRIQSLSEKVIPGPDEGRPAASRAGKRAIAIAGLAAIAPLCAAALPAVALAQGQPKGGSKPAPSASAPASASASAPAPPPVASAPEVPAEDAKKAEARAHFEKAVTLQEEEAWAPALAEFRQSLALFPTRAATKNAAVCLQKLERYDEALEMFERLLRDYPNMTAEDRAFAQRSLGRLQGLVGTLELAGAEPGASVAVDGRARGETPLAAPITVSAGSHVVRVYKDGYLPFETRVDVAGARASRVDVKLAALTQSGRLKVSEAKGRSLDVVVDGVVVGKTPWDGALAPGAHSVSLRGGEAFGTQPVAARIKVNEVTALNLVAEDLEAWVRVEPTPAGASVFVDGVEVGRGVWEGRVRAGAHRIEVSEDGFIARKREIALPKSGREIVLVELERDRTAARWARPSHPFADLSGGFAFSPGFGGGIAERCGGSCDTGIAPGGLALLHAGYALSSGFEVGATVGFVSLGESRTETDVVLLDPVGGLAPQRGATRDGLRLDAAVLGVHAGYVFGERFPITARVGGGVLLGSFTDARTGRFIDSQGSESPTGVVRQSPSLAYAYVSPEVRAGYRLTDNLVASVGVMGFVLIGISRPTWDGEQLVNAGADGVGTYPAETLLGDVVLAVAPSLGVRYEF